MARQKNRANRVAGASHAAGDGIQKSQETMEMIVPGMDVAGATVRGEEGDALLALGLNLVGFKSLGAAGKGFNKVLQRGRTLKKSTLKALDLTKSQGNKAIHNLKKDLLLPNDFHGKIMANGDYVDPGSGEVLGNLYDYLY